MSRMNWGCDRKPGRRRLLPRTHNGGRPVREVRYQRQYGRRNREQHWVPEIVGPERLELWAWLDPLTQVAQLTALGVSGLLVLMSKTPEEFAPEMGPLVGCYGYWEPTAARGSQTTGRQGQESTPVLARVESSH